MNLYVCVYVCVLVSKTVLEAVDLYLDVSFCMYDYAEMMLSIRSIRSIHIKNLKRQSMFGLYFFSDYIVCAIIKPIHFILWHYWHHTNTLLRRMQKLKLCTYHVHL